MIVHSDSRTYLRVACGRGRALARSPRAYLVGSRVADRIVDGVASRRSVSGEAGNWRVIYGTDDISEAMRICEKELTGLDPGWMAILDFRALPSRPILAVEPDRRGTFRPGRPA